MTTPGDGTEPLDPATARWSGGQQPAEPVSLDKPDTDAPLDFDPYRFGKPDFPIAAEYAPPGYTGPVTAPQPPPGYAPPAGYQPPPGYQQAPPGYQLPPEYPPQSGSQPPPYPNFPAVPPPPPYNLQYPQPRTGNGKAIAAMVLGIGSVVFCWLSVFDALLIIPAIIFGVISLSEAKRKPNREGRGMAVAGLACALVGAILATVLTVVVYTKYKDCFDKGIGSSQYNQCVDDHR